MIYKSTIIEVLKEALRRETEAFNYYTIEGEKADIPEVTSLFRQLAEEERRHRHFIAKEIQRIDTLLEAKNDEVFLREEEVRYPIPDEIDFKRVHSLPNIDIAAVSLPTELLGGDFLDTIRLEREDGSFTLGVFIFDVMGHGMKSMYIKALTKKIFGQFFEHWIEDHSGVDMMKPHLVMTALNKELSNDCQSAGIFITSFYGVIDPKEKVMTYTSAGHEPPILVKRQGEYIHFDITELIIGADKDVEYHEEKVPIAPGDTLILYSDGITEVCDDRGEMFEREGLVKAVQKAYTASAKEIGNQIFRSLRSHAQGGSITDDFSMAVLKIIE